MARNKYPEITVEKILRAAQKLFLEKGYDNTTIQDIVDEMNGLTKGAVYHHFKSKEDIMDALGDKMFFDHNPFEEIRNRKDLNGLQKMRTAMLLNLSDRERVEITRQAIPIMKNPRILAGTIETNRRVLSPIFQELIEEGNRDGSITTQYAKELAELLPLLDIWIMPSIYPANGGEIKRKLELVSEMYHAAGLPLFDEEDFFEQYLMDDFCNKVIRLLLIEQFHNEEAQKIYDHWIFAKPLAFQSRVFSALMEMKIIKHTDSRYVAEKYYAPIFLFAQRWLFCGPLTDEHKQSFRANAYRHVQRFFDEIAEEN